MNQSLYDKYFKFICFYAYQLSGNKAIAEDVAQEAFVAYYQQKDRVSSHPKAIKSFLYSSVRNQIYNQHKRSLVEQRYWSRTPFNELDQLDLEEFVLHSELLEELEKLISQLPPACQQVMRLSYFEGLSNQEIIQKLDISINSIKTHRKRGLKFIQSNIDPEFYLLFLLFCQP